MSDPRSEALSALSQYLVAEVPLEVTLHRVAEIAVAAIPAADVAGLTLPDRQGRPRTPIHTDLMSPEVDAAQYRAGRGPCLDAWQTGKVVRIDDMAAATAYPEFAKAALQHGLRSTLSLPLAAGDSNIGALNLYSRTLDGFSQDDAEIGLEMATAASVVLANAMAYWNAFELTEQLSEAMRSRAVIEQAKGVIMASTRCTADEAFDVLREQSQTTNRKLRDIAEEVVRRQAR